MTLKLPEIAKVNEALVDGYFKAKDIVLQGPTTIFSRDGKITNAAELETDFRLHVYNVGMVTKAFPITYWKDLLFVRLKLQRQQSASQLASQLAFDAKQTEAANTALRSFLTTLTGSYDPIDAIVLKQFMWLVKRKLSGLTTTFHVMPILYGPQGVGKSTAISILTAPFSAYTIKGKSVDFVTDERQFKTLSEHYIVIFDEMARANKTDINHLKNIITNDALTGRQLHTNLSSNMRQSCTFIGSTNKPVKDILKDDTGMRRFYQINIMKNADWDALNKVDVMTIWKGIDETQEKAYTADSEVLKALNERQEDLRTPDSVEEFLLNSVYTPADAGGTEIKLQDIFDEYLAYCERANINFTVTKSSFASVLNERGWTKAKGSKQQAYYAVKSANNMRTVEMYMTKKGLNS